MKKDNNKEFGKIYDRYVEKIYRLVYLKVNSKQIAEDIKKFASKHLLNTIVRLMDKEDPIFIIVIINLILTIVGIITNIWW